MKTQTKILFIAFLVVFFNGSLFGQTIGGGSQKPAKQSENFEHIDCGFSFPVPGERVMATSIGYSPYQKLGEGMINRFTGSSALYDIGCIDLDDPPRKMPKDKLISALNSMTKVYLKDASEFSVLPVVRVDGREIYEFETKRNFLRRIKYIFEGNRVLIFLAGASEARGIEDALKLFNSIKYFSVRETAQKRMETATQKSLPQSPAVKLTQTDAAHNNLKGLVKSVKVEAEDVPILVGIAERRLMAEETYDNAGNLLKDFWFLDSGYPTSVTIYGFVDGKRVSDSEDIDYDTTLRISIAMDDDAELPPSDPRFEYRYEYRYDNLKRLVERKTYDNHGELMRVHTFTYKIDLMEEKRFDAEKKLISTERRQLDKNGNELKYEFWWYEETDKEIETYDYKKFDQFGNWTQRRVVKTIIDRGLTRTRTSDEFRTITYYGK